MITLVISSKPETAETDAHTMTGIQGSTYRGFISPETVVWKTREIH